MTGPSRKRTSANTGSARIIARLRKSFAIDYESARLTAHDVMVNLLALSRAARASTETQDTEQGRVVGECLCVLADNLALSELAEAARAYAAACEAGRMGEVRATIDRVLGLLAEFGIDDVTLEKHQPEDEI
jgi:hypothetical protein